MKKLLCIIASAALLVTAMSGCGEKKSVDSSKTTILISGWPPEQRPDELAAYNKMKEGFMKKYPNINVEVEEWGFSIDSFLPKAASGQLPSTFGANFTEVQRLVDSGYVCDVTKQMEEYGYTEDMKPQILDFVTRDGKIYGIPATAYVMGMFANREVFQKAGLVDENGDPLFPKTFDELAQTAGKIKEKTGQAGFIMPTMNNVGGWHFMNIAWAFGTEFMVQEGKKWKATFNSKECCDAVKFVSDLKWKYNALSENILIDSNEGVKMLASGAGAMMFGTPSESALREVIVRNGMDKNNLGVGLIPEGPEGKFALMGGWIDYLKEGLTEDQKDAVFKWFDYKGQTSRLNDESRKNLEDTYIARQEYGNIIGITPYQIWQSGDKMEMQTKLDKKYANVDLDHFKEFSSFDSVTIKPEPPINCQELYTVFDDIIQKVLCDKNVDIKGLLDKAAFDFQANYLDKIED